MAVKTIPVCRAWIALILAACATALMATPIKGSKHDLSNNDSPASTQVCLFCHTPHRANNTLGPAFVPLWNRYVDTAATYTVFTSATLIGTPDNAAHSPSAACLGCHDGTMANVTVYGVTGATSHDNINMGGEDSSTFAPKCLSCHTSRFGGSKTVRPTLQFGKDLRTMHPIAIAYPTSAQSSWFRVPPDAKNGWADVKLINGKVECASCHEVHDPTIVPFLRKTAVGSALCLSCHLK